MFEHYWVFLKSGFLTALNPCALVMLMVFFLFVCSYVRNSVSLFVLGFSSLLSVVVTTIALVFGIFDPLIMRSEFVVLSQWVYLIIGSVFVVLGLMHFRDWFVSHQDNKSYQNFWIPLPKFFDEKQPMIFVIHLCWFIVITLVMTAMTLLGSAWGHDYELFMSVVTTTRMQSVVLAIAQMAVYLFGLVLPLVLVFGTVIFLPKYKGYDQLTSYDVSRQKMLCGVLFFGIGFAIFYSFIYKIFLS